MSADARVLIPYGKVFTPAEITHYADPAERDLEHAIAEAQLIVSLPHAGAAIPAELDGYLADEFTQRLQYDFTDVSTSAVVRRWAEIDRRIVAVENPHPRLVRDPNRARPDDLGARLREAIRRVREAGPYQRVDLTGVDAIRPVTFSFFPLLRIPDSEAELDGLVDAFERVAEQGLGVYERTRDRLRDGLVDSVLAGASPAGARREAVFLSFHDTMNHTTTREGAVDVEREPKDRLPDIVALSNRGDAAGEPRGDEIVTMRGGPLRALAAAHRVGFETAAPTAVALNQPYLGSQEIISARAAFAEREAEASALGITLSAVQAEFLREFLLGSSSAATLSHPGTAWVEPDAEHVDRIAYWCKASWDAYFSRN